MDKRTTLALVFASTLAEGCAAMVVGAAAEAGREITRHTTHEATKSATSGVIDGFKEEDDKEIKKETVQKESVQKDETPGFMQRLHDQVEEATRALRKGAGNFYDSFIGEADAENGEQDTETNKQEEEKPVPAHRE